MIQKFISYYRPHKWLFFADISCALGMAIIDLTFPQITRQALDVYLPESRMDTLALAVGILATLFILRAFFNYFVDYWGHVLGARIEFGIRKDLFAHIQTLSFSYFDKVRTGKIMSRIVNDLREITELAHHGPEDLFLSTVTIIGAFFILININILLTSILFAFIPFILIFGIKKRKKMSQAFMEERKKIADVNAQVENSISGIRVSKSFTSEEHEMEKFKEGNLAFLNSRKNAFKVMAELTSGINLMTNILKVGLLGLGGWFLYEGWITLGALVAYFLYIELFMQPIRRLMQFAQQFESGMAGFKRFLEVMQITPEIKDTADSIEISHVQGHVRFENVSFSYFSKEGEEVLKNIHLEILPGKTLALVGPSGGGKTTLCHLIPRFYDVTDGRILIDGKDIRGIKMKSLRKQIGIVQQDVFLFAGTIRDNIAYGNPEASEEMIIQAALNANIHDFILSLEKGYDSYVGERGVMLSGGQKQRISIARVFLKNPPILILDEATSALDNETEVKIQQSLEDLSKGRTSLVIAHRLSTIKHADEIAVITKDGIVEQGGHNELIHANGHYAKLYRAQFKGYIPDEPLPVR